LGHVHRKGPKPSGHAADQANPWFVGLRVGRIECDELWQYVGCKQKNVKRKDIPVRGDQYTFVALASSARAIIGYHTGKRDAENTDLFIRDLRERVLERRRFQQMAGIHISIRSVTLSAVARRMA
jgi:hypothetical protein